MHHVHVHYHALQIYIKPIELLHQVHRIAHAIKKKSLFLFSLSIEYEIMCAMKIHTINCLNMNFATTA